MTSEKLAYTIPEACHETTLSRATLYRERKAGRLKMTKRRGRTVILMEHLQAYMQAAPA